MYSTGRLADIVHHPAKDAAEQLHKLSVMSSPASKEHHQPQQDEEVSAAAIMPCRLELSLSPDDGSLVTAPLSTVLLSATDGLYTDLSDMAQNVIDTSEGEKEKMSSLRFAQRRHELSCRLAQHAKSISHVAALTAAAASSSSKEGSTTRLSSDALQSVHTAWNQADEAQDALYFFHAQLFPARASPHDVYGALSLLKRGEWTELSRDITLETTNDRQYASRQQVKEEWHMAVLNKLLRGEVGSLPEEPCGWNISQKGGTVVLTYGTPKMLSSQTVYPMEALVTVLSPVERSAEWTLLRINVHVHCKTGESNHQLDLDNRHRYNLHKLCARAMHQQETSQEEVPRPLFALFTVARQFHLSWMLEILSAQAMALKKTSTWSSPQQLLHVTPVDGSLSLQISFWKVDCRYRPPRMGVLEEDDEGTNSDAAAVDDNDELLSVASSSVRSMSSSSSSSNNMLSLVICAEQNAGIQVSLSGGAAIMNHSKNDERIQSTVKRLLQAASDPFGLSASNALLEATTLCGEMKCRAIVASLSLPDWMKLTVERGSIAIAAQIDDTSSSQHALEYCVLFRLECDARSGNFSCTFSRSTRLLRLLACNHVAATSTSHRKSKTLSTGRFVRDAFDSLERSVNLLGQRTGVGVDWMDIDDKSASLREQAIQQACKDVQVSLETCCGLAAVYGVAALSLGVATGVDAVADMTGGSLEKVDGKEFLVAPPLGVVLEQRMVEKVSSIGGGDKKKQKLLERDLFCVSCSTMTSTTPPTLYGFYVTVQLESPASMPTRIKMEPVPLLVEATPPEIQERPTKRARVKSNESSSPCTIDLMDKVASLANVFSNTLSL